MKKSFLIIPVLALIFAMSIALVGCGGAEWPSGPLAQLIPKTEEGSIKESSVSEDEDSLSFEIEDFSEEAYKEYKAACKQAGFTKDSYESTSGFSGYNSDGYELSLSYYSSLESLSIKVYAPIKLGDYTWPTSELMKSVPKPDSTKGLVVYDNANEARVSVEMTKEDFSSYVQKVMDAGFTVDYRKTDSLFEGYKDNHYYVSVTYEGNDIVTISANTGSTYEFSHKDETAAETTTAATTTAAATTKAAESGSTSYKEFLDQYEACMNKYVDFMKSYDPTDLSKLSEYTELLQEYNDFLKKYNDIDTSKLDKSDLDYYVEVQGRVNKKLAELYN